MRGFALIELVIVVAIVALLAVLAWAVVDEMTADTMELRKDEWTCAKQESYTYTTYIPVGKVLVPQIHTGRRCANWVRL